MDTVLERDVAPKATRFPPPQRLEPAAIQRDYVSQSLEALLEDLSVTAA